MPELPDITVYVEAIGARVRGRRLSRVLVAAPYLLRTYDPPLAETHGRIVREVHRLGRRIAFDLDGLHLVLHLMIAGRLYWRAPRRDDAAVFAFENGTLALSEAGRKKRAQLHVLRRLPPVAGLEPLETDLARFHERLTSEVHTVKRALTDPRLFSGIGNAYSDEILHRARLSPLARTDRMTDGEIAGLFEAVRSTLLDWTRRLREEAGGAFPEKVTAFREGMAVHGRFRKPCPECGAPVQRIRYADHETNYCPRCQTGGRILADRSLSRFLRDDWPRTLEELEGGESLDRA